MTELSSIYRTDVRPILLKNGLNKKERCVAFQIVKCRQNGVELTWKQREFDIQILLKAGIDSVRFIPLAKRRIWQEQPD